MVVQRCRVGEPAEKSLRLFRKKVERDGNLRKLKVIRYFSKDSVKKREKAKAAAKRNKLAARRGQTA